MTEKKNARATEIVEAVLASGEKGLKKILKTCWIKKKQAMNAKKKIEEALDKGDDRRIDFETWFNDEFPHGGRAQVGDRKGYRTQYALGQEFVRVPVSQIGAEKGDLIAVTFLKNKIILEIGK